MIKLETMAKRSIIAFTVMRQDCRYASSIDAPPNFAEGVEMAHDTALLTAKDFPKLPQKDASFLSAKDLAKEETLRDEAPVKLHPEYLPGRRPLFRS